MYLTIIAIMGMLIIVMSLPSSLALGYGSIARPAITSVPLRIFNEGVPVKDIVCEGDFQLIIEAEDGSPACVTPDTAQKLIERGWGTFTATSINGIGNQENNGTVSGYVLRLGGPGPESPQANYEVDVYAIDGITIVAKTLTDDNAHYSVQLQAGNYTIYIADYPSKHTQHVSVFSGKNTLFNILYGSGYK